MIRIRVWAIKFNLAIKKPLWKKPYALIPYLKESLSCRGGAEGLGKEMRLACCGPTGERGGNQSRPRNCPARTSRGHSTWPRKYTINQTVNCNHHKQVPSQTQLQSASHTQDHISVEAFRVIRQSVNRWIHHCRSDDEVASGIKNLNPLAENRTDNKRCMESSRVRTSLAGNQLSWRMSRQMSPTGFTLGWKHGVVNLQLEDRKDIRLGKKLISYRLIPRIACQGLLRLCPPTEACSSPQGMHSTQAVRPSFHDNLFRHGMSFCSYVIFSGQGSYPASDYENILQASSVQYLVPWISNPLRFGEIVVCTLYLLCTCFNRH